MAIGLVFEVLGSYGIAFAEFPDPLGLMQGPHWMGLSWVAAWTMLFTVVVPTAPKRALIAALLSVSAVPVAVMLSPPDSTPGRIPAGSCSSRSSSRIS